MCVRPCSALHFPLTTPVCVLRSHPEARLLRVMDSLVERQTAMMNNIAAISACYAPAFERSSAVRVHESGTARSVRQKGGWGADSSSSGGGWGSGSSSIGGGLPSGWGAANN